MGMRDEYGRVEVYINQSVMNGLEILKQKGEALMKGTKSDSAMIENAVLGFLLHEGIKCWHDCADEPKIPEECTPEELAEMMELGWDLFIADGKMLGWIRAEEK